MATKAEIKTRFCAEVLPEILRVHGSDDKPALDQAWNDFTDMLCKAGEITSRQYSTWTPPRFTTQDFEDAALLANEDV